MQLRQLRGGGCLTGTPRIADQCEECSNQPYGAGIDTREVVEQPPGYEAELDAVRSHASVMNYILGKFPPLSSAPSLHGVATWTLTNRCWCPGAKVPVEPTSRSSPWPRYAADAQLQR